MYLTYVEHTTRQLLRQFSKPGVFVDSLDWAPLVASLHPKQKEFVLRSDVGLAGRGGGKSTGAAAKFHRPWAANAMRSSVFVTASAERARDILMPALMQVSAVTGVKIFEYAKARAAIWPNGYRLLFRGCKDANEANKRRGTGWVRAGWDECDSIAPRLFRYDVEECVEPRLVDFAGEMFFTGTPGAIPEGYWHEISSGENKSLTVCRWDARDNPHLHDVLGYFQKALRRICGAAPSERTLHAVLRHYGGNRTPPELDNWIPLLEPKHHEFLPPQFVREYLGLWIDDAQSLCYRLSQRNSYAGPIPGQVTEVAIGLDLGGQSQETPHLDHCAWTVACVTDSSPVVWIPESHKVGDMTPQALGARALQLVEQYSYEGVRPMVYIDSAGAGKLIERQFRMLGIPVVPQIKGPKLQRIQLVQHLVQTGGLRMSYDHTRDLREEASILAWNERHTDHHPRLPDDAWDSCLGAVVPLMQDHDLTEDREPTDAELAQREEDREFDEAIRESMAELDDLDL